MTLQSHRTGGRRLCLTVFLVLLQGQGQPLAGALFHMNGTKLRRLFLCRAEFIRPLAVGGYPHCGYIRDDRWYGNVVGRMNSTLQWVK